MRVAVVVVAILLFVSLLDYVFTLARLRYWRLTAELAAEALVLADAYLDGFVWLDERECDELWLIKEASRKAQAAVREISQ